MAIKEIVFNNRDNSIDLILEADGSPQSTTNITRIDLVVDGEVIISETNANSGYIIWDQAVTGVKGKVVIRLGRLPRGQQMKSGSYPFDLIVFDGGNPKGIVWRTGDNVNQLNVVNLAITTTTTTSTTSTTTT